MIENRKAQISDDVVTEQEETSETDGFTLANRGKRKLKRKKKHSNFSHEYSLGKTWIRRKERKKGESLLIRRIITKMATQMKGLIWNCKGIRKRGVSIYIKNLITQYKLSFIGIQETMIEEYDESVTNNFDHDHDFIWAWNPSSGKSGGILIGIKTDLFDVGALKQGAHMLHVDLWDKMCSEKWNLIIVYGLAQKQEKDRFLDELSSFCNDSRAPYIVGGDFNITRFSSEKNKGGGLHKQSKLFNEIIQ